MQAPKTRQGQPVLHKAKRLPATGFIQKFYSRDDHRWGRSKSPPKEMCGRTGTVSRAQVSHHADCEGVGAAREGRAPALGFFQALKGLNLGCWKSQELDHNFRSFKGNLPILVLLIKFLEATRRG